MITSAMRTSTPVTIAPIPDAVGGAHLVIGINVLFSDWLIIQKLFMRKYLCASLPSGRSVSRIFFQQLADPLPVLSAVGVLESSFIDGRLHSDLLAIEKFGACLPHDLGHALDLIVNFGQRGFGHDRIMMGSDN